MKLKNVGQIIVGNILQYYLLSFKTKQQMPGSNKKVWFMVFNSTFNNISVISWRSVLLAKETLTRSYITTYRG